MSQITKQTPSDGSLSDLREDYRQAILDEQDCETNPIDQFARWFAEAKAAKLKEPNAMALATATRDGAPSCRIVLLKEFSAQGFIFYTNYHSQKGRDCETNPRVACAFLWAELERQVRVEGQVSHVSPEKTEVYFRSRPRGSRLGAWVSNQSETIDNRGILERRLQEIEARFEGSDDIPPPPNWGGYCIEPEKIEFWQGRSNRLHDRILYSKHSEGWALSRLAP